MLRRRGIQQASDAQAEVVRLLRDRLANPALDHVETWPLPRCLDIQVSLAGTGTPILSIHAVFNQDGAKGGVLLPGEKLFDGRPHATGSGQLVPVRERSFRGTYGDRRGFDAFIAIVNRELAHHVDMAPSFEAWALDPAEREFLRAVRRSTEENGMGPTLGAVADLARLHAMENGSYLPTNEHPTRFLMRLAREASDPAILAEACEGLDRMMAPALAPAP